MPRDFQPDPGASQVVQRVPTIRLSFLIKALIEQTSGATSASSERAPGARPPAIPLMKLDIEGAEYTVIPEAVSVSALCSEHVGQVYGELHVWPLLSPQAKALYDRLGPEWCSSREVEDVGGGIGTIFLKRFFGVPSFSSLLFSKKKDWSFLGGCRRNDQRRCTKGLEALLAMQVEIRFHGMLTQRDNHRKYICSDSCKKTLGKRL